MQPLYDAITALKLELVELRTNQSWYSKNQDKVDELEKRLNILEAKYASIDVEGKTKELSEKKYSGRISLFISWIFSLIAILVAIFKN